jgi:urease gamma subunit
MDEENVVYMHNELLLSHKNDITSFAGKRKKLEVKLNKPDSVGQLSHVTKGGRRHGSRRNIRERSRSDGQRQEEGH